MFVFDRCLIKSAPRAMTAFCTVCYWIDILLYTCTANTLYTIDFWGHLLNHTCKSAERSSFRICSCISYSYLLTGRQPWVIDLKTIILRLSFWQLLTKDPIKNVLFGTPKLPSLKPAITPIWLEWHCTASATKEEVIYNLGVFH